MRWGRLAAPNHRGALVPRILWAPLAVGALAGGALGAAWRTGADAEADAALVAAAACLTIAAAGLVDDLAPQRARGLRGHLRSLADGHVTSGLLKLVVAVGASIVTMAAMPDRSATARLAGVVVLAGAANVWNGLDVAPGRALKAFLIAVAAAAAVLAAGGTGWREASAAAGVAVAAVASLPFDLRERAMLGDAGSNLLGFAAGVAVVTGSSDAAVVVEAAAIVLLNVAADTISFSRVIDAVAPLRWLDRLGRPPEP